MDNSNRLLDLYLPPADGFVLESLLATTYQVDFEFFEEELLSLALGVRSPTSRMKAFRSELERRLQTTDVSVLYDLRGCDRLSRLSPRIDPIPITRQKLHSKISLLMWVRRTGVTTKPNATTQNTAKVDRRMRLIVGSANLTRKGFRENYECIVPIDFGGKSKAPRSLLKSAIEMIREIGSDSDSPLLAGQLISFEKQADLLSDGRFGDDDPIELVDARGVLPLVRKSWSEVSTDPPNRLTIISPFWPEGESAAGALTDIVAQVQSPERVELVCRGAASADGKSWVPEFDAVIATSLQKNLSGRLFLRASLPDVGVASSETTDGDAGEDAGEITEDDLLTGAVSTGSDSDHSVYRPLHAKMILLDGNEGSVLYAGSSNCTRRGLGLGGPTNSEAGFVYQLTPKQRKKIKPMLGFFGPAVEVLPGKSPNITPPTREPDPPAPTFLIEVVACGTKLTVRFNAKFAVPDDLRILMEIPASVNERHYRIVYRHDLASPKNETVKVNLGDCQRCDSDEAELPDNDATQPVVTHVVVDVRWEKNVVQFPVRFDDKAILPLLLVGRRPTEGELIDYFLFGYEPGDGGDGKPNGNEEKSKADAPVDTRRILAYFIRRFVQAIPGIESEILHASYSRTAIDAALRGPTSPSELVERAFASLSAASNPDEPEKTPTAVAFQLIEILAAMKRCRAKVNDSELQSCFDPVIARCDELLHQLIDAHPELDNPAFRMYQSRFAGGKA